MRFIGTGLLSIPRGKVECVEGRHVRVAKDERCVFVDTRRMGDGKRPQPAKTCPLEEPKPEDIRQAALFIDLGSTRTLGIVVPDKEADWDLMECRTLDLVDYAGNNDEGPGPFSSQVVLEHPVGGVGEATWPLSEVRSGKAASELYNLAAYALKKAGGGGRGMQLMASSPKRMIARSSRELTWRSIGRGGASSDIQCYRDPYVADERAAEGLVPARLVGMQVVELLEQAERMLNSQEEVHAYRVDEVHVTYPPGWLGPVQENYQKLIQTEVDRWAGARALKVEVKMGCSEALGALVFHWYNRRLNEHRNVGGAEANLAREGETLAVVDVGGGTSDLLIEQINFEQSTFVFKPLRRQSEETAGDELVRRVAVEIVLPALIRHPRYAEGEQAVLVGYLLDDEHVTEKRLWMRKELQPLAQCFAQAACQSGLSMTDKRLMREYLNNIILQLDAKVGKTDGGGELSEIAEKLMESILRDARGKLAALAEDVFGPLAKSFAETCRVHGCTEVKLSGKAMDYSVVADVFKEVFHAQGLSNVGLLVGQQIAVELQRFLGCQTVQDSKYATVWGCICKWLLEGTRSHFAEGWAICILDVVGRPSWYLHGMGARLTRNDCARMDPVGGMSMTIPTLPQAMSYVVCEEGVNIRVNDGGDAPVRMYKLGFRNPDMRLAPGSRPSVLLELTADGKFLVSRVQHGRVVMRMQNGEADLRAGDLEVTPALDYATNAFWLDSGKVELPAGGDGGGCSGHEGGGAGSRSPEPQNWPETRRFDETRGLGTVSLGKSKKSGSGSGQRPTR